MLHVALVSRKGSASTVITSSRFLPDKHCMTRLSLVPIPWLQVRHCLLHGPQSPTAVQFSAPELLTWSRLVWNHLNRVICAGIVGDLLVLPEDLLFGFADEERSAVRQGC